MISRNTIIGLLLISVTSASGLNFRTDCNTNGFDDDDEVGPLPGYALLFDGANDYIDLGTPDVLSQLGEGDFTLEAWVRTADTGRSILIGNYNGNPSWNLEIHHTEPVGRLRFYFSDGSSVDDHRSDITIANGSWHHVAAVRTLGGNVQLFIDGVLNIDTSSAVGGFTVPRNTMIGRDPRTGSHYLDGTIDEVRVWNIARDGVDIAADMYRVLDEGESGLVAYWRFEEGTGVTATDSTGNSDGTMVGTPTWLLQNYDCNTNGILDECDIADGTSNDANGNSVPDECEAIHNLTQDTFYVRIQHAIDHAEQGDEIEIGPGTYVERIDLQGIAITLRSTDGPANTIINGNAGGSVIRCASDEGPDTVIQGFTITNGSGSGGGMYNHGSDPTVVNCVFTGNSASYGGGLFNYASNPDLLNCTFAGNTARYGGAIYCNASRPTLTNCTFTGNSATGFYPNGCGGGMHNRNGSNPRLTNCTFTANPAAEYGGGIYNYNGSSLTLTNCILWGNTATSGQQIYNDLGTTTATYSCIQDGWMGDGNIAANPLFADADGLDNIFGTPDDNVRLLSNSPCIDAGINDAPGLVGITVDLDGYPRRTDDPETVDSGAGAPPIVDMGAYEFVYDCNGNSIPDATDIAAGTSNDCNTNGTPDECDVATGTSTDCDSNGIPDECYGPLTDTLYVDDDATEYGDGSSWNDAYSSLADALAYAKCSSVVTEIRIAGGMYTPESTGLSDPREATFATTSGLTIRGGYAGIGAPDPDERDIELYQTILSGDLYGDDQPDWVNRSDNSYHVVTSIDTDVTAILDGIAISGGYATGPGTGGSGGGMFNLNSSLTLVNSTFAENSARSGGGIFNDNGSPTLTNCTFRRNSASGEYGRGGGMRNYNGNPTLTNCVFTGNSASGGGGGISNYSSSPILLNSIFIANSAGYEGGGLYNDTSSTLFNCILWGNTAPSGPQIFDDTSTTTATYSCIEGIWPGTGNIDQNPLFVDADGPDNEYGTSDDNLHLQAGSPCINTGDDSAIPVDVTTDFEGEDRIQHCRVDMGADETPYLGTDCNTNGISDACDLTTGTSNDCNSNGIPDECDLPTSVLYVDDDAGAGLGDGSSWNDACLNLSAALAFAKCSGVVKEIRVAGGTYTPDPTGLSNPRDATLAIISGITIRGGYAGIGTADPDERDVELYETTLSGDLNGDDQPSWGNHGDNSYHVVTGTDTDNTAVLIGVTITGGYDNRSRADGRGGGGMYNYNGNPTLTDCTFTANAGGPSGGGGMFNDNGSPTLTNCTFTANSAHHGGGVYSKNSSPTLTNCTFNTNSAERGPLGGGGGGLVDDNSSTTLNNCVFIGNWAKSMGGGMYSQESTSTVINCTFSGNIANCEVASYSGGGAIASCSSGPTIINCTLSGNLAIGEYSVGGGLRNMSSDTVLTNCIVWGNSAISEPHISDEAGTTTATYSCIESGWAGVGNIDINPLFADADGTDNVIGTPDDDVRLQSGSPCINTGNNSTIPLDVTTDFEGDERIQQCRVDMGVDETVYNEDLDCNNNGILDACDIAFGTNTDCNGNGVPDQCDIAQGTSSDANGTNILDECESIHNVTQDTWHSMIQHAVSQAQPSDEIEVNPGTYVERVDLQGKAITLRSTDGPTVTIIDGNYSGSVILCTSGEGPATIIQGFTLTNGQIGQGGGMCNRFSSPTVTDCIFSENSAIGFRGRGGGGMYNYTSSPTVINCTFNGNSAESYGGGGMLNDHYCSPTLTNCIFSGNSAEVYGGGMRNTRSSPTLTNCTFSGNSAGGDGGGIFNCNDSSPVMVNCIVWGNTASSGPQIYDYSSTTTATYSCIEDSWPGTGNIDPPPLFVDADGPDDEYGTPDDDLHLQPGSPCINTGDNSSVPVYVTTDFEGDVRIQQCRVDMGADETPYLGTDCNTNGTSDACDLTSGTSNDCNTNSVPDECEDCNNNGVVDNWDIALGTSTDCNSNSLPDECDDDGYLDLDDLDSFVACLSGPGNAPLQDCRCADIDNDGDVDLFDYHLFLQQFANSIADAADLDSSGKVDLRDFAMFQEQFGTLVSCPADLNGDGEVDLTDYDLFQRQLTGP